MLTLIKQREQTSISGFLIVAILLICQLSYSQAIPFEVEDYFEIQDDPDIGIKLMPEEYCENSTSDAFGFVFKRNRRRILSDPPAPPNGDCEDIFADPYLEFYPEDFNNYGFVNSSLGTAENRWSTLYVGGIQATGSIYTGNGGQYSNQIILPRGRNLLQEDDGLADDGVIFSPSDGQVNASDITLWAKDDIVMNFSYSNAQINGGQFKVTEGGPLNTRFKVGSGGTIFMPELPSVQAPTFLPNIVIDPSDGQLYYVELPTTKESSETEELFKNIKALQDENSELKQMINTLITTVENQAKELKAIQQASVTTSKTK